MAKIQVTVEYDRSGPGGPVVVRVTPPVARVNQGDEVQFTRKGIPGRMKITFHEPRFFSKDSLDDRDDSVTVTVKLSARTTYLCELFDNVGNRVGSADGASGGAFEPGG